MSEILYLKPEKKIRTYNRVLTLGEAVEMQCADPDVVNRLKTEKLYVFQDVKPGRHACAGRAVLSILDVVEKIQTVYPKLEIQNLGETDFVAEYSTRPEEKKLWTFLKVSLVCALCFFGSAFSIMAFNNDVSTVKLFRQFYTLLTGPLPSSIIWAAVALPGSLRPLRWKCVSMRMMWIPPLLKPRPGTGRIRKSRGLFFRSPA